MRYRPKVLPMRWYLATVLLAFVSAACSDSERQCTTGADCASGICRSDGSCAPVQQDDVSDGADASDDAPLDLTSDPTSDGVDTSEEPNPDAVSDASDEDAAAAVCSPNHDGVIERSEVSFEVGLRATFRAAHDVTVDMVGTDNGDGTRTWDLSGDLPGDFSVVMEFLSVDDRWFADSFPNATHAARISTREDYLGVFQAIDDDLLLQGVASPDDGLTATELSYTPEVPILRFPLELDDEWEVESTVVGRFLGVLSTYFERYDYEVDARGELLTPFGTFDVLRVRVTLTRTVGLLVTVTHSFAFVSECFGTVANVVSQDNEASIEFSDAAEVYRLAP